MKVPLMLGSKRISLVPSVPTAVTSPLAGFTAIDDPGELATALDEGELDVAVMFVTDPALVAHDLVVLEDDLMMSVHELPVLIGPGKGVGESARQKLADVFARIDTGRLRDLNERVLVLGRTEAVSAFLAAVT